MAITIFKKKNFIQLYAAIVLVGYWFVSSILGLIFGGTTQIVSIIYRGVQFLLSIIVMVMCREELYFHKNHSLLSFYVITMFLYSIRMVLDMFAGPFVGIVPTSMFLNDFLYVIVSIFVSLWALFSCSRYLDIDRITELIFWMGLVTLTFVYMLMIMGKINYEEGRVNAGRGLGTLSIARLGAFEVLASVHMLLNGRGKKIFYIIGVVIGVFIAFASGSRGGVAGMILALGVYWILSSRRNAFFFIIAIIVVVIVYINIIPILEYLSNYFPILSNRFLMAITENDQSGRQEIRQHALKLILDNPIMGYSYRMNADPSGYGPHNGILEIFLTLGIPFGLLYIYFIYIKGMFYTFKLMNNRKYCFATLMTVFVMVTAMSGGSIDEPYFGFAICLLGSSYYYGKSQNINMLTNQNTN